MTETLEKSFVDSPSADRVRFETLDEVRDYVTRSERRLSDTGSRLSHRLLAMCVFATLLLVGGGGAWLKLYAEVRNVDRELQQSLARVRQQQTELSDKLQSADSRDSQLAACRSEIERLVRESEKHRAEMRKMAVDSNADR